MRVTLDEANEAYAEADLEQCEFIQETARRVLVEVLASEGTTEHKCKYAFVAAVRLSLYFWGDK